MNGTFGLNSMTTGRTAGVAAAFAVHALILAATAFAAGGEAARACECCGKNDGFGAWLWRAAGETRANTPRVPEVDHLHMKLELVIPDMNRPLMLGTQTLTVAGLATPAGTVTLDAAQLDIASVSVNGVEAKHTYDGATLVITMDPPLEAGQRATIVTAYKVDAQPYGLYWFPESPDWPGRPAQIHTQGQPETNRYWFPCHDQPNERLSTELIVTVPQGYVVSSNGVLKSKNKTILTRQGPGGSEDLVGFDKFHFVQAARHVNYLVSMVVGKFDIVDVGTGGMPMPVYAPPGRGRDAAATYKNTAAMVEFFGKILDEPYPWDKYAQVIVHNTVFGGMENTSATTMWEGALIDRGGRIDTDVDGLISHELAHQWFGDLLTCNSWEHIWLNEGFATYLTALWFEHARGRGEYEAYIRNAFDGIISRDKPNAPAQQPMASNVYGDPWEVFRREANPYGKGASVLHMLRVKLGSEAFFRGIAQYINTHRDGLVVTDDFETVMEAASGQDLGAFFAQWVRRPGVPMLKVTPSVEGSTLTVSVMQNQNIDANNPAFEFELPVVVKFAGEVAQMMTIAVRGKDASASMPASGTLEWIAVDPGMSVLAGVSVEQAAAANTAVLASDQLLSARVVAARDLIETTSPRAPHALTLAASTPKEPLAVRTAAIAALGARGDIADLESLRTAAADRWETREAVLNAMVAAMKHKRHEGDSTTRRRVAEACLSRMSDASSMVRAAAIRGLGETGAMGAWKQIVEASNVDSQHDRLRQAALDAFVAMNDKRGLAEAVRMTRAGNFSRTRPLAVTAVRKLASHDPDLAFTTISGLLNDIEARVRGAAGEELVALRDPRGIGALQALAAGTEDPADKARIAKWISELSAPPATNTP
jgi:aminopeptidase N